MTVKLARRAVLQLAAGAVALPALSRIARAQAYPTRPIRLIVGFPAGGTADIAARLIGQWLSERLGQPVVVENRVGASTNIATEMVVRAPADGHTLLATTMSNIVNATLFDKLDFDFIRDIAPVASTVSSPLVLEAIPAFPAGTVPQLIAHAKANPGRITMASFGVGTISHLAGELFKISTGIDMVHVPYRGSAPMVTDLLGGQVQVAFDNIPASIEHIRAGKLRPLALTSASRSPALPAIPAMSEFLPGYEVNALGGIGAPRNTPPEIIARLNTEINAGLADARISARLVDLGGMATRGSPADFGKIIADETEKWGRVIRAANIKPQ